MEIFINENPLEFEEPVYLDYIKKSYKPGADLCILNGFVVAGDRELSPGDRVIFITRGEVPEYAELQALMMARHTPGVHEKVNRGTVGIAGLGGLGSSVAIALARTGVGRLIIVDFDVVEPSNLNRQQYFITQLGQMKVDALAATLEKINPYMTVERYPVRVEEKNIKELFESCDVVVEAFDSAMAKSMLINAMPRHLPECYLVTASGLAGYGTGNTILTRKLGERVYVVGDLEIAAAPGTGLMAPRVGIAAHHQAAMVLRILLGEFEP